MSTLPAQSGCTCVKAHQPVGQSLAALHEEALRREVLWALEDVAGEPLGLDKANDSPIPFERRLSTVLHAVTSDHAVRLLSASRSDLKAALSRDGVAKAEDGEAEPGLTDAEKLINAIGVKIMAAVQGDQRTLDAVKAAVGGMFGAAGKAAAKDFSQADFNKQLLSALQRQTLFWIGDAYDTTLNGQILKVYQEVLRLGLGLEDATDAMVRELGNGFKRTLYYWQIVSSATVGRTRNYGYVEGYRKAKISRFRVVAIGDDRTCAVCSQMNGKTFEVSDAQDLIDTVTSATEPDDIRTANPWTNASRSSVADGTIAVPVYGAKAEGQVRAPVVGYRSVDANDPAALVSAGVFLPPYHGLCRCRSVAAGNVLV